MTYHDKLRKIDATVERAAEEIEEKRGYYVAEKFKKELKEILLNNYWTAGAGALSGVSGGAAIGGPLGALVGGAIGYFTALDRLENKIGNLKYKFLSGSE